MTQENRAALIFRNILAAKGCETVEFNADELAKMKSSMSQHQYIQYLRENVKKPMWCFDRKYIEYLRGDVDIKESIANDLKKAKTYLDLLLEEFND